MKRTFQRNFTIQAKLGLVVFLIMAGYFFWQRQVLPALFMSLIVVAVSERVLHSAYTFDGDELIINKGRFVRQRRIRVDEITNCRRMRTTFGLVHYLLLEYGAGHLETVEPAMEVEFIKELNKRLRTSTDRQSTANDENA
ncbi:MAG: PH domain-containing protein [Prevotella sp.]